MNLGTTTLLTNRLKLRKITFDDVQSVFSHLKSDERITDNLVAGAHTEIEQTRVMVEEIINQYDNPGFYHWGIEITESKELIGLIDLYEFAADAPKCHVGYMLGFDWWNQGYGTEALAAVVDFALNKIDIKEVSATHNTDNPASGRIMEKVGMKKDRVVKDMIKNAKGDSKDCAIYRIER